MPASLSIYKVGTAQGCLLAILCLVLLTFGCFQCLTPVLSSWILEFWTTFTHECDLFFWLYVQLLQDVTFTYNVDFIKTF